MRWLNILVNNTASIRRQFFHYLQAFIIQLIWSCTLSDYYLEWRYSIQYWRLIGRSLLRLSSGDQTIMDLQLASTVHAFLQVWLVVSHPGTPIMRYNSLRVTINSPLPEVQGLTLRCVPSHAWPGCPNFVHVTSPLEQKSSDEHIFSDMRFNLQGWTDGNRQCSDIDPRASRSPLCRFDPWQFWSCTMGDQHQLDNTGPRSLFQQVSSLHRKATFA